MTIKTIIFDLDRVLYRGDEMIPGADTVVKQLRSQGKQVFFLTNSGTRSRDGRLGKLRSMNIEAKREDVYTSSFGAAHYISKVKPGSAVFCIGESGLREEMTIHGLFLTEKRPDFVVASLDRNLSYRKLGIAYLNISHGSKFIATNTDPIYPVENDFLPGAGSIVAAVEYSTGKKPFIIGKPNTYLMDLILKNTESNKDEILFVGDKLETDIAMAKKVGIKSCLVLTGVSKQEDLENIKEEENLTPDHVLKSVADLPSILQ